MNNEQQKKRIKLVAPNLPKAPGSTTRGIKSIITKGRALCMFFGVPHTTENAERLLEGLSNFGDARICYKKDQKKPVIVSKKTIYFHPFKYHAYQADRPQ